MSATTPFENWPTVAAVATAHGTGGVAVVRVSGLQAHAIAKTLFVGAKPCPMAPGRFYYGTLQHPHTRQHIDDVVMLVFAAPRSYTGEDVIEFHGHGSPVLTDAVLQACFTAGAQPAPPGEFTKRAFLNGKLDLTQAESVMDLVSAKSPGQARLASANLRNRTLGEAIERIRETLTPLQAQLVASMDFPDEVDEPERTPVVANLRALQAQVEGLLAASQHNAVYRSGLQVALLGLPNAGKSSLFNALLASDRAIVTEIAGTTRDVLSEVLTIDGVAVTLLDTAGIRTAGDAVEVLGIARTWQAADDADAVMYVYDSAIGLQDEDHAVLERLRDTPTLVVANKCDLSNTQKPPFEESCKHEIREHVSTAVPTGMGLEQLRNWLQGVVRTQTGTSSDLNISLNQRQQACLHTVAENLAHAADTLAEPTLPIDLATVPVTEALREVDRLMGRDTTEVVLDSVFAQFCVGK